jgi:hypothetical protein
VNALQQRHSVQARQLQAGQHHVEGGVLHQLKGGGAIVGALDLAIRGVQGGTQQAVHIPVVIHNQDALRQCHPM